MNEICEVESGRFRDLHWRFGIPRSTAYALLNEGKIKSRIVKVKGSRSGIRLIDFNSVRAFLASCPEKPSQKISEEMFRRGSQPKNRKEQRE
jgi:hypothetical protein